MPGQPKFSVVVGFRNRDVARVQNSLNSLAAQTYKDFELLFIDYGSDLSVVGQIKPIVEQYDFAQYVYNDTRGWFWNRSHAFNSGIKRASGEITLLWDIDLMVEPDFLSNLLQFDFNRVYTSHRCYYLPEVANATHWKQSVNIEKSKVAYVGLSGVKTTLLKEIGGFNEFYQVWGAEDDDLAKRLEEVGLKRQFVNPDKLPVYHQWHPTQAPGLPNMWYLTMIEVLGKLTERPVLTIAQSLEFELNTRPVQMLDSSKVTQFTLDFNLGTLVYNELLFWLSKATSGEAISLKQRLDQITVNQYMYLFGKGVNTICEYLGLNLRLENKLSKAEKEKQQNTLEFFKYVIGVHRDKILDYYFKLEDGYLQVILIKK